MSPLMSAALAAVLLVPAGAATAGPAEPPAPAVRDFGNGPERNEEAAGVAGGQQARTLRTAPGATTGETSAGPSRDLGYPRRTRLPEPAANPADASVKLGLVPYHGIAPRLNDLQRRSDRVSAEIIGHSAEGRDLYLVTVTAPESRAEAREQTRLRELIENDPAAAARDRRLAARYKAPLYVNANIHGNEWEGTDAVLRTVEELATSTDPAVAALLARTRLYFNVTANPDGRVNGVRPNGNGFDLNRDFVTASQPEVRAMRRLMIDAQPVTMIDLHGYVNGTLIEPTTPPHGANYEYDLFIRNAYANGLGMEAAVNGLGYTFDKDGVRPAQIPFRDSAEGWDDWPPIFTPQYAPFHGTVASHTVEIPLRVNNADYVNLPVEELRRRSAINTDVAAAAVRAAYTFVRDRHDELIADQIEVFRRGAAGEPARTVPLGIVPGFGPEDVYTTTYPRAYVITGQRSATAAARLVDHLVANDVRVERARHAFRADGRTYPAGSYVVDLRQPKRGLANVMLEPGADISPRVDAMYDISGWSHALLWGATVTPVTGAAPRVAAEPVRAAAPTGSVPRAAGPLALQVGDAKEVQAVNDLLAQGVALTWTAGGRAIVPADARRQARTVADRYGVTFTPAGDATGTPLTPVRVAAAVSADELFTLREMGFQVTPVSTAVLNAGFDWSATDVLFVSSGLSHTALNPAARAALDAFLATGGVVTRGGTGAAFNAAAGLLTATAVAGRSDANGVVRVVSAPSGAVGAGSPEHSFVYSPRWFTGLGPEVTVEQAYAADGPLVAGHWRPDPGTGAGGPEQARGQAAVISGRDERGAAVVMFGTEPMFRNHPKGLFPQVARALYWSAAVTGATAATP
ncbi:succinylglutamate desuccinylase/aspartoacylase family protein [Actinomadura sp. ATCC 31491]|uniref:Succinylglutamate desuccinylase/aspartoacylase family protein n=1 Tax=Actinomadura luzonensis TaxID=2805427 RepID=A0ABT0FVB0_9ACTN|nr:M14 family zinc carboxypeptidase [Actinomadura luzonensis]MCK2216194.1 succinylglutamate desuccinylase/aspartoacylase family protein [Actinomadura luzonensis]